jgi:hypothetical protein
VTKPIGKIDAFRRDLEGKACPSCGSEQYHFVLREDMESQHDRISACCSQCQRVRMADEGLG